MAINSRQKGRRGELEVAKLLSTALDIEVKLNYEQSAAGGYDMRVWGWAIEVKRAESPEWSAWQRQALQSAWREGLMPILFHRRNHARNWDCYLPISVFLVVWGGEGPFTEDDWLRVSLDVAVATMKNSLSQKNPGDLPGQTLIREHKETHVL
ncbi:MAG: hypothetical protein EBS73_17145 [Betaproteobacteria bacterium]|nr:hypothetical protein [Betaproteobacteria bacterium]